MATSTILDYRRLDQRRQTLENPYWLTSKEVVGKDAEDKVALLFSFPKAGLITLVHEVVIQITTAFTVGAGAAVGVLGTGTIATDTVTTAGTLTDVDQDDYIISNDVTWGTVGYYWPVSAGPSDFVTAKAAGTISGPVIITGAATTVPCVGLWLTNAGGAITAGKCRIHMLVSDVPGISV